MMNKLATVLLAVSTIGCAAENDGVLDISGQLADATQVTHVVATNPTTGEHVVVDLKSDGEVDGRFRISLPSGAGSWVVTFANGHKKGAAMKVATLQSGGLDAFRSKDGGALEFGTINFSGGYAHGTVTWDRLAKAFGESVESLRIRAKLDNLSLRYSNPDVDGDGEIDALQGRAYRLDISGTLRMQTNGRDAEVGDLVHALKAPTLRYLGTTIQAAIPSNMGMNMLSGTMQFEQPFFGTALGSDTPMVNAYTRIGHPHIKFGELHGTQMVGVVASGERNAPSGSYKFGFDNGQLTFTDVLVPAVGSLASPVDYSVPFVRLRPTAAGCTADCAIESVDLKWMRATSFGWERVAQPRDARIDIIADVQGKRTYLAADIVNGATSQLWRDMPVANTGLVRNELSYISTASICYLAVSYTSELGMKMTSQVQNPGCF